MDHVQTKDHNYQPQNEKQKKKSFFIHMHTHEM
jgi:ribosomal protein L34